MKILSLLGLFLGSNINANTTEDVITKIESKEESKAEIEKKKSAEIKVVLGVYKNFDGTETIIYKEDIIKFAKNMQEDISDESIEKNLGELTATYISMFAMNNIAKKYILEKKISETEKYKKNLKDIQEQAEKQVNITTYKKECNFEKNVKEEKVEEAYKKIIKIKLYKWKITVIKFNKKNKASSVLNSLEEKTIKFDDLKKEKGFKKITSYKNEKEIKREFGSSMVEALKGKNKNDICDEPVKFGKAFYIFKVEDRIEMDHESYEVMKDSIKKQLGEENFMKLVARDIKKNFEEMDEAMDDKNNNEEN